MLLILPILNYSKTVRRYVYPIMSSVLLHSKRFEVVQGHVVPTAVPDVRSVSDSWHCCMSQCQYPTAVMLLLGCIHPTVCVICPLKLTGRTLHRNPGSR